MNPFQCAVHTHSACCDGKETLAEMAAGAYAAGVKCFGASGHSYTPMDEGSTVPADMTAYRQEVLRLREEYAGRMDVLLGLEVDSCSPVSPTGLDYWIGSVHYQPGCKGDFHAIDWDAARLVRCRDEVHSGDALAMAERYYREVAAMAARKPPILGHIDLITKLNAGNRFFDETAPRYQMAALQALHAVDAKETVLEINTGGMARGYRDTPYPALFLLKAWREMGGRVMITSDAHRVADILFGYDQAVEWAKAAGFQQAAVLTAEGFQDASL